MYGLMYVKRIFLSTTNKMHLLSQIIYSCKMFYMFRTAFPYIIKSSKLSIQYTVYVKQLLLNGICQTAAAQRYMSNSCCSTVYVKQLLLNGICQTAAAQRYMSNSCCYSSSCLTYTVAVYSVLSS